jgi:hypothetical protein
MKQYRHKEWKAYREQQIKLHDGRCAHCLGTSDEVILQVHHLNYVSGRMPWEYPLDECEVLCRGCHAKEHGIIKPSKDWLSFGFDDLGGLDGVCDRCQKELRYAHMVSHPLWGTMIVGEKCADRLTESTVGTEGHAEFLNYVQRRKTFVDSSRWKTTDVGVRSIRRLDILIEIFGIQDGPFLIHLNGRKGKVEHPTLLDAQISAFDFVESGQAASYFKNQKA